MRVQNLLASLVLLSACLPGARDALAQLPPGATDPKACSPGERLQLGPNGTTEPKDPKPESPSEKLSRTEGVLCPPNIDAEIKAPTPNVGTMPVIPPPGSP